jgi:catechol 2,3-dioxygenase-like lactoylglutathione lyase family enzyme
VAKLRHIALSVQDLDKAVKFFVEAFDMKIVGPRRDVVCNVSDGTINVALLALNGKPLGYDKEAPFYGIEHFGMWVDDIAAARQRGGRPRLRAQPT